METTLAPAPYHLVPNIGPFWVIDGLHAGTAKTAITFSYIGLATGYALLITTAFLCIAIVSFQKREVG